MLTGNGRFRVEGNRLVVEAIPEKDFFVNPVDGSITANAAFVYEEIEGDFVCKARISLAHKTMYDAGVLLAMQDETHWAKACFELGDYGFKSVCTVMTNGLSDDCNGITVNQDHIWMQLARTGDVFTVHYSLNGEKFFLARICSMPFSAKLKVGFEAQSPCGEGGERFFDDFRIEKKTLTNPRMGE
ncbi:MAG: DUF1349 domain-containing protein [Erysipelotrichaceae bacterium]|nr:DUF1349 domain-containing protein [Erysipelotrichaceae bacterium]